jgi:hypothetical protein
MRTQRLASALLVGLLASLVMAGSAMAARPEVILKNEPLPNEAFVDTESCPGLSILNEIEGTRSRTLFYDRDGNETRLVIHVRYRLSFTNIANGVTLTSPGVRNIELDFVNNTFTDTGVYRNVVAPGEGTVLHQSGRLVETLDTEELIAMSGPHDEYVGELARFCSALAG